VSKAPAARAGWIGIAVWGVIGAGVVAAFWPLFSFDPREGVVRATTGMEGVFFDPSGEDPRLIGALAFWMGLTRRGRLATAWRAGEGRASWAAALFAGALAVSAWATHTGSPDLLIHSLQLFVLGAAALLGGAEGLRAMRLPVLFLFLAMPIPPVLLNEVLLPLQLATVQACTAILTFFGLEAWGIGDQIFTPRGVFHVIETCSGVRLVQTLVMASIVYGELFGRSAGRTALLVVLAPVVAIVVNLARILSIIFNPYSSISSVHTTQGVVMVVIGVLVLAGLDRGLERLSPRPLRDPPIRSTWPLRTPDARTLAVGAVLLGLLASWLLVPRWMPPRANASIHDLSKTIEGRRSSGTTTDLPFLGSVHFSDRIERIYTLAAPTDGSTPQIRLFLGEDDHTNRRGSMLSDKTAFPGRAMQALAWAPAVLEDGTEVETGLFAGPESRQVIVHWREGFRPMPVEATRAWAGLDRSAAGRSEPARVWRVSAEVTSNEDIEPTRAELLRFAQAVRSTWRASEANVRTGE